MTDKIARASYLKMLLHHKEITREEKRRKGKKRKGGHNVAPVLSLPFNPCFLALCKQVDKNKNPVFL